MYSPKEVEPPSQSLVTGSKNGSVSPTEVFPDHKIILS